MILLFLSLFSLTNDIWVISPARTEMAWVTSYTLQEGCMVKSCFGAAGRKLHFGDVACPRALKLGQRVQVGDIGVFTCADRTHKRFDGRYDIYDTSARAAKVWGLQWLAIIIL